MMTTESQEIADLFRNPRKVQRTLPFKRVASHTYGKGSPAAQPGGEGSIKPDTGPPPGPGDMTDPDWPRPKASVSWGY